MSDQARNAAWRSAAEDQSAELSDEDLEAVVGGLTRAFVVAPSVLENAYTVTPVHLPVTDGKVSA